MRFAQIRIVGPLNIKNKKNEEENSYYYENCDGKMIDIPYPCCRVASAVTSYFSKHVYIFNVL